MREDHRPGITDPLVEPDPPVRGLGLEVRCDVIDSHTHSGPATLSLPGRSKAKNMAKPRSRSLACLSCRCVLQERDELAQNHRRGAPDLMSAQVEIGILHRHA